jgi:hypothetical protein
LIKSQNATKVDESKQNHRHLAARALAVLSKVSCSSRRWLPWANLLRRVFAQDVLACPCGGRRTVTAFVVDTTLARSVLTALGLAVEPTSFAPARDPPQVEFAWDDPT